MECLISHPSWLRSIIYPTNETKLSGDSIPIIWVESPILTASFYRQYLNFSLVFRNLFQKNGATLLFRKGNFVFIKASKQGKPIEQQKLFIFMKNTDNEYTNLLTKVVLIRPYCATGKEKFVIKDCNGIEVAYCSS